VPLALDAENPSAAREYLSDVRQAACGALGDAKAGSDAVLGSGARHCRDRGMIERDQSFGAGGGIGGSGQ
jgi:hypothetical protein